LAFSKKLFDVGSAASPLTRANSSSSLRWSELSEVGTSTCTRTSWSPWRPRAERGHALRREPEGRAAGGAGRDLARAFAEERGHLDAAPECGERELDRDLAEKRIALPLEELVVLNREHDVEVAVVPALHARFAVAA